jgi:hypothetical protein
MTLNSEQVDRLLTMIRHTRDVELTCPECLDELHKYTQRILDDTPIEAALEPVQEHLEACPCCTNQFELVLETLKVIDE